MAGVFAANPLSLSVPDDSFETWLRDTGYLEVLDERSVVSSPSSPAANQCRRRRPAAGSTASASDTGAAAPSAAHVRGDLGRNGLRRRLGGLGDSTLVGVVRTLLAIIGTNPFAKLAADDFSASTPPWTAGFITGGGGGGEASSYAWPAGPAQARMRIQENVKRYVRNYVYLWLLFFACALYKMPLALVGLFSSLAVWEVLRVATSRWDLEERYPGVRSTLVRVAQIATAVILYYCNLHAATLYAIGISYTIMILHASLRKLMSSKQPAELNRRKRSHHGK